MSALRVCSVFFQLVCRSFSIIRIIVKGIFAKFRGNRVRLRKVSRSQTQDLGGSTVLTLSPKKLNNVQNSTNKIKMTSP